VTPWDGRIASAVAGSGDWAWELTPIAAAKAAERASLKKVSTAVW
jgi:hypothetical protein